MPNCSVSNCNSSTDGSSKVNRDIAFYRFPQDLYLKEKWIRATGRKDWYPTKCNTICSNHFTEASFVEGKKGRKLTTTACPTIKIGEITKNREFNPNMAGPLVKICLICLATDDDVKLFGLHCGQLKLYMDTIVAINSHPPISLPQFVCYECAIHLKKCYNMIKKCETSQAILVDIFEQYGEITKALVKNVNKENLKLKSPLEAHNTTPTYFYGYKYNYEQNMSCLTKIQYIYDSTDNKMELDKKSDDISIRSDHIDDIDVTENMKVDYSAEKEIDLDTKSIIITVEAGYYENDVTQNIAFNHNTEDTIDSKSEIVPVQIDHNYVKDSSKNFNYDSSSIETDDSDDNDVIESLELKHDVSNKRDANCTKSVSDIILCDGSDIDVEKAEEVCIALNNKDNNDSSGLLEERSDKNTANVLGTGEKNVKKNNVKNKIKATQSGEQSDEIEDIKSPLAKYFKIVKLTTLQEKIDDWRKSLENPSWAKEDPSKVHKCDVCWKLFTSPYTLQQHSIVHSSVFGNVECPVCRIWYENEEKLKKHMIYLHSKRYYCKLCPKCFTTRSAAAKHHLTHAGDMYKCDRCPYSSLSLSELNKHITFVHLNGFACDLCDRGYLTHDGLLRHQRKTHSGLTVPKDDNKYPCDQCTCSYPTQEALRMHLQTSVEHKEFVKKSTSMENTCKFCDRQFLSSSDLAEHIVTAHTKPIEYPMVCKHCDEVLKTRTDHYWHMRREHPDERYNENIGAVCDVCGKGFQTKRHLRVHLVRHSSPTLPCPICGKKFHDRSLLEQHVNTHRSDKPHVCPTCGNHFKNKASLCRHMKIHTDVNPYECSYCGKHLRHKLNLRVHIRTIHHKILSPSQRNRQHRQNELRRLRRKKKSKISEKESKT